jgi:hypothetical protein
VSFPSPAGPGASKIQTTPTPTWSWQQIAAAIAAAIAAIPDRMLLAAGRFGATDDAGCRLARAEIDDHVRRQLQTTLLERGQ